MQLSSLRNELGFLSFDSLSLAPSYYFKIPDHLPFTISKHNYCSCERQFVIVSLGKKE